MRGSGLEARPRHLRVRCYETGGTTDQISLDQVIGDGVLFDLGELAPRTEVDVEQLERADPGLRTGLAGHHRCGSVLRPP